MLSCQLPPKRKDSMSNGMNLHKVRNPIVDVDGFSPLLFVTLILNSFLPIVLPLLVVSVPKKYRKSIISQVYFKIAYSCAFCYCGKFQNHYSDKHDKSHVYNMPL